CGKQGNATAIDLDRLPIDCQFPDRFVEQDTAETPPAGFAATYPHGLFLALNRLCSMRPVPIVRLALAGGNRKALSMSPRRPVPRAGLASRAAPATAGWCKDRRACDRPARA